MLCVFGVRVCGMCVGVGACVCVVCLVVVLCVCFYLCVVCEVVCAIGFCVFGGWLCCVVCGV